MEPGVESAVEESPIGETAWMGFGVVVGSPTGVTLRTYVNRGTSIELAFGGTELTGNDGLSGWAVLHRTGASFGEGSGAAFRYRIGLGASTTVSQWWSDVPRRAEVAVIAPQGFDLDLESAPVQLYVELGPSLVVHPRIRIDVSGGAGVRCFF